MLQKSINTRKKKNIFPIRKKMEVKFGKKVKLSWFVAKHIGEKKRPTEKRQI